VSVAPNPNDRPSDLLTGPDLSRATRRFNRFAAANRVHGGGLRGANAADLPVQHPLKHEFVINLNTAKPLGISVPLALRVPADQVIE
jgi:putative ABC transport system substrate-binding protein